MTSVDELRALERAAAVDGRACEHFTDADPATPADSSGDIVEAVKFTAWHALNATRQSAGTDQR